MLTPFGKAVRRYRDEIGASLKQMADFLEIPSSYLSAMEHGKKNVSKRIIEGTFAFFGARGLTLEGWASLAEESPTHVKLDLTTADELEREVYETVGRRFKTMPDKIKVEIRDLLRSYEQEVPRDRVSRRKKN